MYNHHNFRQNNLQCVKTALICKQSCLGQLGYPWGWILFELLIDGSYVLMLNIDLCVSLARKLELCLLILWFVSLLNDPFSPSHFLIHFHPLTQMLGAVLYCTLLPSLLMLLEIGEMDHPLLHNNDERITFNCHGCFEGVRLSLLCGPYQSPQKRLGEPS